MRLLISLRDLLQDLRGQRTRTFLTILGIAWGTTAVMALLAFGVGLKQQMMRNARGIGDAIAIIRNGQTTKPFAGYGVGRPIRLRAEDVDLLAREVPGIGMVAAEYGRYGVQVRRGTHGTGVYLTGVPPNYGELRNVFARAGGRFIDERDMAERRRVAFLGDELERLLFGDESAVGRSVLIDGTPFTVVGVMVKKTQNSSYSARDQDRVFIPASTYASLYGPSDLRTIVYHPRDPREATQVRAAVRQVLGHRYNFDPTDEDAIRIWDTAEQLKFFEYLFLGFNLFMGVVGSFTLVVGGVGVANVMYVVVQERTREIGVRRSVGARRRDILGRILLEAGFLVFMGAALGLLFALGIIGLARLVPIQDYVGQPTLSPMVGAVTVLLLGLVTILSGYLPARRAALIEPVEALRYGA
jgi:putative ABC transport system permease protein